jgi:hypothetical protein
VLKWAYQELVLSLTQEFTHTVGGATLLRGLIGSYLSKRGKPVQDPITLLWVDTHLPFQEDDLRLISEYAEAVRQAVQAALEEEAVWVVVTPVYHLD